MIKSYLVGEASLQAGLSARGELAQAAMHRGVGRLALKLVRIVQQDKLSGQVLGVKTGRLRRSVHDVVLDEGSQVLGVVSTNVAYGIGWETGWTGAGVRASLADAKGKFAVGSSDTFKNGTPKKRSFLASALRDLENSGAIRSEGEAMVREIAA